MLKDRTKYVSGLLESVCVVCMIKDRDLALCSTRPEKIRRCQARVYTSIRSFPSAAFGRTKLILREAVVGALEPTPVLQ
jgi:hypothetical protein